MNTLAKTFAAATLIAVSTFITSTTGLAIGHYVSVMIALQSVGVEKLFT